MIFPRKTRDTRRLMLEYAPLQVICNSRIKHARRAREDIHMVNVTAHVTDCAIGVAGNPLQCRTRAKPELHQCRTKVDPSALHPTLLSFRGHWDQPSCGIGVVLV